MFSARRIANPVEGFLRRRLRGLWFAALLGLLAPLCVGQDPVPQNPVPQNPAPQNAEQSPESQAPSENDSSSKPQPPPASLPKSVVPPNKVPQSPPKQVPQNQSMISLDSSETIFFMELSQPPRRTRPAKSSFVAAPTIHRSC